MLECIYCLTQLSGGEIYYLLHREQLNVSELDNGHLQVVLKHLVSSYKNIYMGSLVWGREG